MPFSKSELRKKLVEYFTEIDSKKYLELTADHLADFCMFEIEDRLWADSVGWFVDDVMFALEFHVYKDNGRINICSIDDGALKEFIFSIYEDSEFAQRVAEVTDLRDKTELKLPNGETIPINQHLLESKNDKNQ